MIQKLSHDGNKVGCKILWNICIPVEGPTDGPWIWQVCPGVVRTISADPDGVIVSLTPTIVMTSIMSSIMTSITIAMPIPSAGCLSHWNSLVILVVIDEIPPHLDTHRAPESVSNVVASTIDRPCK